MPLPNDALPERDRAFRVKVESFGGSVRGLSNERDVVVFEDPSKVAAFEADPEFSGKTSTELYQGVTLVYVTRDPVPPEDEPS